MEEHLKQAFFSLVYLVYFCYFQPVNYDFYPANKNTFETSLVRRNDMDGNKQNDE